MKRMNHESAPSIRVRGRLVVFDRPMVMGIINVTPDSFYSGSRAAGDPAGRALEMLAQGADMLDIGAYSTRPGAAEVSAGEEYSRLARALEKIRAAAPDAILSIDTFRAGVAAKCVREYGADIINDIGGGTLDSGMRDTVAALGVPYIMMHMRGNPQNMQTLTEYRDVTADILSDLAFKVDDFRQAGVHDIIVDPGFGFAKTVEQNYRLLHDLRVFRQLGCPLLAGMSRKSMLFRPLGITPEEAGAATVAAHTVALMNGADIIRTHDVLPAVQSVKIVSMTAGAAPEHDFDIEYIENPRTPHHM